MMLFRLNYNMIEIMIELNYQLKEQQDGQIDVLLNINQMLQVQYLLYAKDIQIIPQEVLETNVLMI